MIKFQDLLPLPEEQVLPFSGNIHLFFFCIIRCTLFYFPNSFPILFVEKMTDLSMKEQKRLMLEARATRRGVGQSTAKSDLSGLETRS